MVRLKILFTVALLMLSAHARGAGADAYTVNDALREFHDLSLLAYPAQPQRGYGQTSSWDRNFANYDQGNFLREDGKEMVLLDVRGPGVLTRLWTAEPMGYLQFYFDGAAVPQLAFMWSDLQNGKVPPFAEPFLTSRGGGCVLRFPMTFEKGLKITLTGQTWCHWQADYQYFAAATKVKTWLPGAQLKGFDEELAAATKAWKNPGDAVPGGGVTIEKQLALSAGSAPLSLDVADGLLITEISFEQATGKVIPKALEFVYGNSRIPWRDLAGVWESDGDSASLLQGRHGTTSYFRVPFVVDSAHKLSLAWNSAAAANPDEQVLGMVRVRTMTSERVQNPFHLFINRSIQKIGEGTFYKSPQVDGAGRLLIVGTHVDTSKAEYIEGDNTIFVDGESFASIRGTGFEDFFDSAWYFEKGNFATAVAASPVQEDGLRNCAARATLWPLGLPFNKSLRLEWEAGAQNEAVATTEDLYMVGQTFSHNATALGENQSVATTDLNRIGARETTSDAIAYTEYTAPITAELNPKEAWIDGDDAVVSGTLVVNVDGAGLQKITLALDLPLGWKGTLSGANQSKEVFDI
ncbi:MAG: DUF2961 domain-containing protein, partial [Candidatus Sumerlaeota bacterium]